MEESTSLGRSRRRFTTEFKAGAVALVLDGHPLYREENGSGQPGVTDL